MQNAINEVINENIWSVVETYGIKSLMPLCRYEKLVHGLAKIQFGYYNKRQIFSDPQEIQLKDYILKATNIFWACHRKKYVVWHMNVQWDLKYRSLKCGGKIHALGQIGSQVL